MIRNILENDIDKINRIGQELYDNFENIYDLKSYIYDDKYHLYLIEQDNIIGFMIITENIDVFELDCIVVKEKYRGLGVGKKLLSYFVNNISKPIILEVSDKNERAIHLYEKLGFKRVAFRKNYYKNSNAIIMKLVK